MKTEERRIGQFSIARCLMDDWRGMAQVMKYFVVVRCELDYASDNFNYTAYSDLFEVAEDGCCPPSYEIVIDSRACEEGGDPSVLVNKKL